MQVLIDPLLRKEVLNRLNPYIPSYLPTHGEFKNLCFVSVAPMVCMSHAFFYDAVDVNKIVAISSIKPPSYACVQVTAGLKLYLG